MTLYPERSSYPEMTTMAPCCPREGDTDRIPANRNALCDCTIAIVSDRSTITPESGNGGTLLGAVATKQSVPLTLKTLPNARLGIPANTTELTFVPLPSSR